MEIPVKGTGPPGFSWKGPEREKKRIQIIMRFTDFDWIRNGALISWAACE